MLMLMFYSFFLLCMIVCLNIPMCFICILPLWCFYCSILVTLFLFCVCIDLLRCLIYMILVCVYFTMHWFRDDLIYEFDLALCGGGGGGGVCVCVCGGGGGGGGGGGQSTNERQIPLIHDRGDSSAENVLLYYRVMMCIIVVICDRKDVLASVTIPTDDNKSYHYVQIMMASSNGNIFRVNGHLCGEFTDPRSPSQRPVTPSFDVFFDLRPNKRLSKQLWGWWFETLSSPLWRHCNDLSVHNTRDISKLKNGCCFILMKNVLYQNNTIVPSNPKCCVKIV